MPQPENPRFMFYRTPFGPLAIPNSNMDEDGPIPWSMRAERDIASRMIWYGPDIPTKDRQHAKDPEAFCAYIGAKPTDDYQAGLKNWDRWYKDAGPWWLVPHGNRPSGHWTCRAWTRMDDEAEDAA